MTPERWARVVELFEWLADRPAGDRQAMLTEACAGDVSLRDEVERMLDSDVGAGTFGDSAAFRFTGTDADQPGASLQPGSYLGRYRILELLAAGGMGEVYRARDPELGRDVGIKVLSQRAEITIDQLARFDREARAVAALNHPNILTVYDVGVDRDIPYVVSELLDGETLRARLDRGALPIDEAVRVARQVLAGLAAAHGKGIIHRDLKPQNLFLTGDGVTKILDFGLAKQLVRTPGREVDVTERGVIIGTAGYMAPEQIRGEQPDVRSDLFSFGAVLYEMLTGARAFTGQSAIEIMHAVLAVEPPIPASLPPGIRGVVAGCLAKTVDRRFDSAQSASAALTASPGPAEAGLYAGHGPAARLYAGHGPIEAGLHVESAFRRTRAGRVWGSLRAPLYRAAAVLMAIGLVGAAWMGTNRRTPPRPGATGRPALAVMPFEDRTGDPAAGWLSTGVPSMIVTSLAQTPGLDVIGTERLEASFRELGRAPSDRTARGDVARHAGAGALLVGTLFKVESGLRLDVQLQEVDTGRVVAASTGQGADLFAVVDAIARDVRDALDLANRPAGRPLRDVTTASLEAYQLYTQAQRARHNNRMADARTLFEEALRIDPAFTLARAHLLTTLERLGENGAAEAERNIVRSQLDRLPERQRLLAEAIQEYDVNAARALELLEQLISKYPDEEEAYDAIVHAYTHARDPAYWRKALAFMQRWARAIPGPGSGHFHNHYGYAYIEHGLFTEAEREFRAYIRVSPGEANAYDSLAELYLMTGRPQLAIEQYDQALRLNPMFGWSHFGRAYAHAALGRYDDAFAALMTARNLGARGDVPPAFLHMVEALLQQRVGRYREASIHLDRARSIARDFADTGAQADIELFDAMLSVERGHYQRAIASAERAVDASTLGGVDIMKVRRSALAHLLAGLAETGAGRLNAARSRLALQQGLDVGGDPIQASFRHGLRGEIALREGRLDDAEAAFKAAEYHVASSFAIYPALVTIVNNLPVRDGLARTATARGDLPAAIDWYRRLNQPDVTSKSNAVFDAQYARTAADLAGRSGNGAISRSELARYAQVWKGDR